MLFSSSIRFLLVAAVACTTTTTAQEADESNILVAIREETDDADGITAVLTPKGDDRITVEMTSTRQGYLAFGFSLNTKMADSVVVAGLPDAGTVLKYDATSYDTPAVSSRQTLEDTSIVQNGTHTILTFTKLIEEDGEPTVNLGGSNIFIWAVGGANNFAYHSLDRGDFSLDFAAGEAVVEEVKTFQGLWMTHGIMMVLSWVILIPIGVGVSVFRSFIPGDGTWFKIHRTLNSVGLLLMVIGFIIAFYIIGNQGGTHFTRQVPHRLTGLIISLFGVIQGLWGAFRPHAPHAPKAGEDEDEHPPEAKSSARVAFEYGHRILGVGLLATAWYNTSIGLDLFSGRFGTTDFSLAMWIIVAIITIVTVGLGIKQRV